jgi:dipeptidase E
MKNLLLISNSTNAGEVYLGWPREYIKDFYQSHGVKNILFIPYAGVNLSGESIEESFNVYEKKVADVFSELGLNIQSIHRFDDPVSAVNNAEAVAVGGGNTFHLVYMMHKTGAMKAIREKVLNGMPYSGWSAGANVACPTMKTTNDMPITEPESFNCLNLVPFQINPHYLDVNPEGHGGETRQQRIEEFLAVNRSMKVVGLREGTLLQIEGENISLKGKRPMVIFEYGKSLVEYNNTQNLQFLLSE